MEINLIIYSQSAQNLWFFQPKLFFRCESFYCWNPYI